MSDGSYIPALAFSWLRRFYDPLIALTVREKALRGRLIDQAAIAPGHDVLDVGCGNRDARNPAARGTSTEGT